MKGWRCAIAQDALRRCSVAGLALLLVALAAACERGSSTAAAGGSAATTSTPAASTPLERAREEFARRCASCHGAQGTGDGAYVPELALAPPSFHDPKWQAAVTDAEIENAIQHGGESVGKSAAMPSFPDFSGQPERLAAMRDLVRSFAR